MLDLLADFTKGLVIGVSIAAPVGPIGILCMRTTLTQGMTAGFVTGLGAATADAIYAALGAFGIGAISVLLKSAGAYLQYVGIGVLIWIAWTTWHQKPANTDGNDDTSAEAPSLWIAFASTCGLTLANPMTILSFAAIFAGAGLATAGEQSARLTTQAIALVCGTFVGSMAWWLFLSGSVAAFRAKIRPGALAKINKVSATILLGFAAWMTAQATGL